MTRKVIPLVPRGHLPQRYPWRFCGSCEWLDSQDTCINEPYEHYVKTDRRGCRFWECLGCGGGYDDVDAEGNLIDHSLCMVGMID